MATRAERFKAMEQRSGATKKSSVKKSAKKSAKKARAKRSVPVDTSLVGVDVTSRRAGGPSTARRNLSKGKTAIYALEDTVGDKRPSRKSTRRSKDHIKAGAQLKAAHELKMMSPQGRHARQK